jgi:alkylation response protein AidB-like acyl-CoA dehydrogenase
MTTTSSLEDAELLRDSVRDALRALSTSVDVRRAMATSRGFDERVWHRLSGELGLPGLTLPAEFGGSELTERELAVALEEAGATLLCAPLFATAALAVPLLRVLGDKAAIARYAAPVSAGELTATVALAEDGGRWRADAVRCAASCDPSGWVLDGVKNYVVDGATAGLILVVARVAGDPAGELGVFAVPGDAPGLAGERLVTLDQTRKQARLVFCRTPAERLGAGDAAAAVARATAVSRALLAAEQVGGAQQCLDMTVGYAKTRIQFARPIGSFQAVKQKLAEMLVRVESARSAALAAVTAAATGDPELEHVAAIAALTCGETYTWVTEQTIQLHGGIGFTWEHDAHLYFKRARSSALLLGTAAEMVELIGRGLEATVS